jgi:nucleotide-binding universal stress UspA family protein
MFKHILVPTDGSQLSQEAVKRAIAFAKETGARITFFYAKPEYPVAFYGEGALIDPTTPEKFAQMADEQAKAILDTCAQLAAAEGVTCATLSKTSDVPYEAIIAAIFAGQDDPRFGPKPEHEFRDLFSRIVNLAPPPIGVGPAR